MASSRTDESSFHRGAFYKQQYQHEARRLLRKAMESSGVSCRDLARKLTGIGLPHTADGLATKISRGTFSAAFFLVCLRLVQGSN
ncbi:DUF6471 domain-containing protein [Devosia sp.]|uniref:DUF6471 domain-containing protein n=1 Tax=Devosia sp. TaxID=1871048 RepID=UPI0039C8974B